MRIKTKEEVMECYQKRYEQLDQYFLKNLSEEYDRYYLKLNSFHSREDIEDFFEEEIQKNEQNYKDNALIEGVTDSLEEQYLSVLASYGLIVFFRDHMIDWEIDGF